MDLITNQWISCRLQDGTIARMSPVLMGGSSYADINSPRPDFHGATYQFLIGLLQTAYAPQDVGEWRERYEKPPNVEELTAAFEPLREAFLLENDGPAFMQDFDLPADADSLSVIKLLIDAGSKPNQHFNKLTEHFALCESCAALAVFTLQVNAPPGGSGTRCSVRGSRGPLTTLLLPTQDRPTLWQKLWLNIIPASEVHTPKIGPLHHVFPWLAHTRKSDGKDGVDTTPNSVHPLQAYWGMPRRIRLQIGSENGSCSICGAENIRVITRYRNRHGGTNYTGAWIHPLTPHYLDADGIKPPYPCSGSVAGTGYKNWLGLVLGNEDHRPDAAIVVSSFFRRHRMPAAKLWCFGYSMSNMNALCWYDSTLPVHHVSPHSQRLFTKNIKLILDSANDMASMLHKQVKAAWFRRPGDAGSEPVVNQSFWQGSEKLFYEVLRNMSELDFENDDELARVFRRWLHETRGFVLGLFDHWALSGPLEHTDLQRVVKARADLAKELSSGKAMKPLWKIASEPKKEKA